METSINNAHQFPGCIVLERVRIVEIDGITKTSQLEGRRRQPLEMNRGFVDRMNDEQRRRVFERQEADRRHNMNFVFRFNELGELPTIEIFDENRIATTFGFNEDDMNRTRSNVRRLNSAIRECALGDYTDLWRLGFRADFARQYTEIADVSPQQMLSKYVAFSDLGWRTVPTFRGCRLQSCYAL